MPSISEACRTVIAMFLDDHRPAGRPHGVYVVQATVGGVAIAARRAARPRDLRPAGPSCRVRPVDDLDGTDIPPGRFALLSDPQGGHFSIIELAQPP